jgi:hypothetical protein
MHAGMMLRQLLNQIMLVTKPWQRVAIAAVVVAGGLAMVPAGIVLGHYGMSLGGALILAVAARIGFSALRARLAGKAASE